jgi:hypothetical protein
MNRPPHDDHEHDRLREDNDARLGVAFEVAMIWAVVVTAVWVVWTWWRW